MPPPESRRSSARRVFTAADQLWFAESCGDWNAVHLDPLIARRSLPGRVVVHGMHIVAWALESWLQAEPAAQPRGVRKLTVTFMVPASVAEDVEARAEDRTGQVTEISVFQGGQRVALLRVECGPGGMADGQDAYRPSPVRDRHPRERRWDEIASAAGEYPLGVHADRVRERFPKLAAELGSRGVAELLALGTLVGMECPGKLSLFAGFACAWRTDGAAMASMRYSVASADRRFSKLTMAIRGGCLEATVTAFALPPPYAQAAMDVVVQRVKAGEFSEQLAVVVGGSRGLGETTAKLIGAGGGRVILTYREGRGDGERVTGEIRSIGGHCDLLPCDAGRGTAFAAELKKRGIVPTHVYYFASPKIAMGQTGLLDEALSQSFWKVYVYGFHDLWRALRERYTTRLVLFYPSSVAVAEPARGFSEYAQAKAAGETLARYINATDPGTRVLVRRLQRLATDQTQTLLGADADDPLETMLDMVREMSRIPGRGLLQQP